MRDTRTSAMPAFGKDGILKPEEIRAVANYVRTLAGLDPEKDANLTLGKKVFADNCVACHGDDGKGNVEMGSAKPDHQGLAIWLRSAGSDLYDRQRPQQHHAGVARPTRSGDHQVARRLCSQPGRRQVRVLSVHQSGGAG